MVQQPKHLSSHIGFGGVEWASAPPLWRRMNRLEELLQWAEQCAAANGIVPPYMQERFEPESVEPHERHAAE